MAPSATAGDTLLQLDVQEVATDPTARPPFARSGHMAAPLPSWHPHEAIIMGGYAEEVKEGRAQRKEVMDAWTFEAAAEGQQGGGSWRPLEYGEGPTPPPRLVGQVVLVGDSLYLIGGWNPGGAAPFLSDIWCLDLRSRCWALLQPQCEPGAQLPAISRFQAVAVGTRIYIHHHRSTESIHVLDVTQPSSPVLSKVPVKGEVPSSRGLHSLTAVCAAPGGPPDALVLFGGAPQHGPMVGAATYVKMGDLYTLDLATLEWRRRAPSGPAPSPRCASAAAATPGGGGILYFGGACYKDQESGGGGLEVMGDARVYDMRADAWRAAAPAAGEGALPAARNAATLVPTRAGFLLHGGWVPFVSTFPSTHLLRLV